MSKLFSSMGLASIGLALSASVLTALSGCGLFPQAEAGPPEQVRQSRPEAKIAAVDVLVARQSVVADGTEYVGTTNPVREVSLRSQVEGRLLRLTADTGDRVTRGQLLARLDESLLAAAVNQTRAELASLESEIARAEAQVSNARTQLERARLELQQAQTDADRFTQLAQEGAVNQQQAEASQTAAKVAQQAVLSAQQQIRTEEKAVAAARGRVAAQNAAIAQAQARRSYAKLIAPINGVILERTSELGNLVSPGGEVLKIGDFSRVKIVVPVSELDLAKIQVGQSVQVRLDAFPNQTIGGSVSRISPAADPTARQIPIEVTIPNPSGRIGSGLLARVSFRSQKKARVVVPNTALEIAGKASARSASSSATLFIVKDLPSQNQANHPEQSGDNRPAKSKARTQPNSSPSSPQSRVEARTVTLAAPRNDATLKRSNNQVEILSGLQPGERFVVKSSRPLNGGELVQLSILSE